MKNVGWKISRYLLINIGPYFAFSWLLLSVILFVQQAGRFADIFFSVSIPKTLVFQLTFALIPSVIAFTCPMAILVGVIIGLSKMQGDSELTAIRAAGVGNLQITLPVAILGLLLSFFALFINIKGVPFASGIVRDIALRTALLKLESPIEPGVFNTDINGFTVYVRNGDVAKGEWRDIFIFTEDKASGQVRLITARSGRIDSTIQGAGETAELVLSDAKVITLPRAGVPDGKTAGESFGNFRFAIKTRRDDIVKRLTQVKETPEELGLSELADLARTAEGKERDEAMILWQRRVLLSISPLLFAILGCALVLRFGRGGRGFGIFLALVSLVSFYVVTLLGEQLTRTGIIGTGFAGLAPLLLTVGAIVWLFNSARRGRRGITDVLRSTLAGRRGAVKERIARENVLLDLTTGIRDFDIVANLFRYFVLTGAFLAVIFLIFTAFEHWKFAGAMNGGIVLLIKYLFFLLPFLYLQIAPSALMIATLATFVIKSRANETVTWAAAGQSIYRLLAPCFLFMILVGAFNWVLQETIAPYANRTQDAYRDQIRSRGASVGKDGRYWVATSERIYSFSVPTSGERAVSDVLVVRSGVETDQLSEVIRAPEASYSNGEVVLRDVLAASFNKEGVEESRASDLRISETDNPFANISQKPNHLTSAQTRRLLETSDAESEKRALGLALNKKYSTPLLPLIITLFTAPFALTLSRRGKAYSIGFAVASWLVFMAVSNGLEQSALGGTLPAIVAVWAPLAGFAGLGVYLLSRVRT